MPIYKNEITTWSIRDKSICEWFEKAKTSLVLAYNGRTATVSFNMPDKSDLNNTQKHNILLKSKATTYFTENLASVKFIGDADSIALDYEFVIGDSCSFTAEQVTSTITNKLTANIQLVTH